MALRLPRLSPVQPSWAVFQRWWQSVVEAIEQAFADLAGVVEALVIINGGIEALDDAVAAAQAAADDAQAAADGITATDSLRASYTAGLTITATDAGADATIAISAHTRVYADGTSVAVDAGSITALAYSTAYWVYYQDAARAGGAVTYEVATTVQGNGIVADRHFVGATWTPAAAGGPIDGVPVLPPGGVFP